jgi:hypothetical protein
MGAILHIPRGFSLFNSSNRRVNEVDLYFKEYKEKHPTTSQGRNPLGIRRTRIIMRLIILEIRESLIEKQGGVFIEKFGYFFVWKAPKKISLGDSLQSHMHTIQFNPVKNVNIHSGLYEWTINRAMHPDVKKRVADKIGGGFKYKNYLYTLRGLVREYSEKYYKIRQDNRKKKAAVKKLKTQG